MTKHCLFIYNEHWDLSYVCDTLPQIDEMLPALIRSKTPYVVISFAVSLANTLVTRASSETAIENALTSSDVKGHLDIQVVLRQLLGDAGYR